jgi:ABC-2 type transport system ATP-binding protein
MKASAAKERGLFLLKKLGADEYWKKRLQTLSKGNQQKIQLAIALINDPEIIILDEPFSGLDPVNSMVLKELVQEVAAEGRMVFFSSHEMGYVEEFCDDILIMDAGQIIVEGNLKTIKRSYPRNRVLLVPEIGREEALKQWIASAQAPRNDGVTARNDGILVTLRSEKDKNGLLAALSQTDLLDGFRVVEPTLEEIFIERVGGNPADGERRDVQ